MKSDICFSALSLRPYKIYYEEKNIFAASFFRASHLMTLLIGDSINKF